MARLLLAIAAAATLAACGPTAKHCDTTCQGCCDSSGQCQSGNLTTACGVQGAACGACGSGQACVAGACESPGTSDSGSDSGTGDAGGGTDSGSDGGTSGDGGVVDSGNPSCVGPVPLVYNAATDRDPHPASPPSLGPAGTILTDPTYGTRILRLTDVNTNAGTNLSYKVANEFWGNDWNTDATLFYVQASSSGLVPFQFSPSTLVATRVMDKNMPTKPLAMPLGSGGFSLLDPHIFYGIKGLSFAQLDFSTQTVTTLLDLHTLVPDAGGYSLGVEQGANGLLATSFGGPQQDKMPYVATWDPATGVHHLVDVLASTLDGVPLGTTIGGQGVHTIKIDKSGRFVSFAVTGAANVNWLWDTTTQSIVPVAGTGAIGSGAFIKRGNADSYDWQLDYLGAPDAGTTNLITPLLSPKDNLASSSIDWMNAVSGALAPIIVDTMRQPADTGPWRAWDDEVVAVRTDGQKILGDGGIPQTEVWRFAHTFNTYTGTIYSDNFYYLFIPRVSQNGWFVLFDSNWNQSLGTDSQGNPRTDVFIAALPNPCGP